MGERCFPALGYAAQADEPGQRPVAEVGLGQRAVGLEETPVRIVPAVGLVVGRVTKLAGRPKTDVEFDKIANVGSNSRRLDL
jgi:hypothetical protein